MFSLEYPYRPDAVFPHPLIAVWSPHGFSEAPTVSEQQQTLLINGATNTVFNRRHFLVNFQIR